MGKQPKGTNPKPSPRAKDEKPQRERFIETARALGVDETGAEFERALEKIAPPKPRKPS
jgi:hypothetical protein